MKFLTTHPDPFLCASRAHTRSCTRPLTLQSEGINLQSQEANPSEPPAFPRSEPGPKDTSGEAKCSHSLIRCVSPRTAISIHVFTAWRTTADAPPDRTLPFCLGASANLGFVFQPASWPPTIIFLENENIIVTFQVLSSDRHKLV